MKRVGVVLSGCGVLDGSEIHESVITLLALDSLGAKAVFMAPKGQLEVVNHLTNEPTGEKRDIIQESARIARGKVADMADVSVDDFDALVFPGGFGAAKNLSNFASVRSEAQAHPEVARLLKETHAAKKPIGVICIAPATLAAVLGPDFHPTLTVGNDSDTVEAIEKTGAKHQECSVREFVVDIENKIISTPAYMLAQSIQEAADGIKKLIVKLIEMS